MERSHTSHLRGVTLKQWGVWTSLAFQWLRLYAPSAGAQVQSLVGELSVLMRWMKLEPIIQSEVSQKEKHQYSILMHIYPGLRSPAVAWPPSLSARRRESGSQRPWLGEAAPQPEGNSVCPAAINPATWPLPSAQQ